MRSAGDQAIDQLNSFLRGELSAVESYRLALDRIDRRSFTRPHLETCLGSHERRAHALEQRIHELGGAPARSSGGWGGFVRVIERGAVLLGEKAALATLEEGEGHGLADYRGDLGRLDGRNRDLVITQLLPEQEQTHRTLSALRRQV